MKKPILKTVSNIGVKINIIETAVHLILSIWEGKSIIIGRWTIEIPDDKHIHLTFNENETI